MLDSQCKICVFANMNAVSAAASMFQYSALDKQAGIKFGKQLTEPKLDSTLIKTGCNRQLHTKN